MARFRYRMQNLLNIKMKMEDQAKQEFSAAKLLLDEEEQKLESLQERRHAYERKAQELLKGRLDVPGIEENKNAILVMDSYVAAQTAEVQRAEARVAEARERMTVAMQERKTHEILRENAFEEFLREENRAESKAIDELTSYTFGRRQEG